MLRNRGGLDAVDGAVQLDHFRRNRSGNRTPCTLSLVAYIERFRIYGLAGNQIPLERTLHRTLNVFWGLNGGGKTSLLKILHGAFNDDATALQRVPFERAEISMRTNDGSILYKRTLTKSAVQDPLLEHTEPEDGTFTNERMIQIGEGLWQEVSEDPGLVWVTEILDGDEVPGSSLRTASRIRNTQLEHTYLPISRLSRPIYRGRPSFGRYEESFSEQGLDDAFAEQISETWRQYNTHVLASVQRIQQKGLAEILATLFEGNYVAQETALGATDHATDPASAMSIVSTFLEQQRLNLQLGEANFRRRYASDPALPQVVQQIQEVQAEIEQVSRPQRTLERIVQEMFRGKKRLLLATGAARRRAIRVDADGSEIPLQSLSSGEKQLLRLMLEVLSAKSSTVMIDEPELSMHVDWQRRLVASMQQVNPGCQLLLATHSPEIVAQAPYDCAFEL